MNLAVTPGLGSLVARHRVAGGGQVLLSLAGFALILKWLISLVWQTMSALQGGPAVAISATPGLAGGLLFLVAWLWSLITSLQLLAAAKKNAATPARLNTTSVTWQKTGEVISRRFEFSGFPEAMNFVNDVAQLAEQAQHHPDIDIRWNKVTLALTTHDAGGLTDKDYTLALACDELYLRQLAAAR